MTNESRLVGDESKTNIPEEFKIHSRLSLGHQGGTQAKHEMGSKEALEGSQINQV